MSKKNYSVARVVTHTQSTIGKCERHNERKNESYANMNVDTARCDMNVHFKSCGELTYNEQLNKLIAEKKVCMRGLKADAKVFDEMIFDVNTDYFETHGGYEYAKEFYAEAYRFAVNLYGEQNIISAVMSRFGRNYVEVGLYTESYFPENNIRFIAITDLVDSADGDNEIIPFKNVMNEMYARDISKKVRSAKRIRGNMGEPLSQPPYGYMKDPENPKRWIIEHEAASIVREIFRLYLEGYGQDKIARTLQDRGIKNCTSYWQERGIGRGGKKVQPNPYKWKSSTIGQILIRQEYCGDVVNFKTYSKSFKNKKRLQNPEENWKIFKDVHESIIDRETFEAVQDLIKKCKRRDPKPENGDKNIFCDFLVCAECGHKLWYHVNTRNKDIHYFSCSNYVKDYRGSCQHRHYVRADAIEQIVMLELKKMSACIRHNEERFAEILARKTNSDRLSEQKYLKTELERLMSRNAKVERNYEKLYEDNMDGKVTDEWFMHMSKKYEEERVELRTKISKLREQQEQLNNKEKEKELFVSAVRKFMEMETLTAPLLHELIDHIDIYETEGTGKNRTQRIVIHYRFVGYIVIPSNADNYKADTRQGVAVEYLTA